MALLNRWSWRSRRTRLALACVLVGLAGCAVFGSLQNGPKPFAFSHRLHVEDQGLGCTDCHAKAESAEDPGMPKAAQCALCHVEIDAQKPPERKVSTLFADGEFKAHKYSQQAQTIVFSHQKHATRGDECTVCHEALAKNDAVVPALKLTMENCQKCHTQRNGPAECSVCHPSISKEAAPPNHSPEWNREHGRVMRAHNNDVRAERCDLCHTPANCLDCHKAEPPQNHTNYWRLRGHGLSASMDRRSCMACHAPESCEECHSVTKPMNHTGSWGSPTDHHCLTCHEPLRTEETCQVCHKSTPSHALAAPMPSWHIPSMNCRQCHGHGQPLPHVDNGESCIQCHH